MECKETPRDRIEEQWWASVFSVALLNIVCCSSSSSILSPFFLLCPFSHFQSPSLVLCLVSFPVSFCCFSPLSYFCACLYCSFLSRADNILLDDVGHLRLSDFGLAVELKEEEAWVTTGKSGTQGQPEDYEGEQARREDWPTHGGKEEGARIMFVPALSPSSFSVSSWSFFLPAVLSLFVLFWPALLFVRIVFAFLLLFVFIFRSLWDAAWADLPSLIALSLFLPLLFYALVSFLIVFLYHSWWYSMIFMRSCSYLGFPCVYLVSPSFLMIFGRVYGTWGNEWFAVRFSCWLLELWCDDVRVVIRNSPFPVKGSWFDWAAHVSTYSPKCTSSFEWFALDCLFDCLLSEWMNEWVVFLETARKRLWNMWRGQFSLALLWTIFFFLCDCHCLDRMLSLLDNHNVDHDGVLLHVSCFILCLWFMLSRSFHLSLFFSQRFKVFFDHC